MQMEPRSFCGFCECFGGDQYSRSLAQTAVPDALECSQNVSSRTHAEVLRVEKSAEQPRNGRRQFRRRDARAGVSARRSGDHGGLSAERGPPDADVVHRPKTRRPTSA